MADDHDEGFLKLAEGAVRIPDFSNDFGPNWASYCAPTAAANVVYCLGTSAAHAPLLQNKPLGPDANPGGWPPGPADTGASKIIAGLDAPPHGAGSLAQRMNTTVNGSTTAGMLKTGRDAYLEADDN